MVRGVELGRPLEILLVEDSPSDADLTKVALKEGKVSNRIHHVVDGVEALTFLRREGKYADVPRPDIVLLDLKMPRMDGHEVLEEIRNDPKLRSLIVVVLTTSPEEEDIMRSYGLNSNAYIIKPVDLDQFFDVVKSIDNFFFQVVALPPNNG